MILVSKFPLMYYLRKELGILLSIGGYQHLRGETQCLQDFFFFVVVEGGGIFFD